MLRHVISPARCFVQLPNAIVRHPKLSSQAVHLLAWQISLPPGAEEPLNATARRAKIKKTSFQKAKRELIEAGFVHEWRVRIDGGHYAMVQLISNESLTAEQAAAVRDGQRPAPARARLTTREEPGEKPQVAPGDRFPAAGQPTGRSTARPPKKNTGENTTDQPAPAPPDSGPGLGPDAVPVPAPVPAHPLAEAEALLRSLAHVDRRLAMPGRTARKWSPLASRWLAGGLRPDQVRSTLTQGLADARSPLGVLRWRLEHALPDVPPPARPEPRPASEPRLARMRECAGDHTQTRLFLPEPGSDTRHCRDCRAQVVSSAPPPRSPSSAGTTSTGYDAFRAARRALSRPVAPNPAASGLRRTFAA